MWMTIEFVGDAVLGLTELKMGVYRVLTPTYFHGIK